MKMNATIREGFDFDSMLLVPRETSVKPAEVITKTRLTREIELGIPLVAAGCDSVTESAMAIALAQLGGIGIIHDNMPLGKQVEEVRRVKRAEGKVVSNPITVSPETSVAEAFDLMSTYKVSGLPVVEQPSQKVVGIITHRDIRFFEDYAKPVSELMTKNVISVRGQVDTDTARRLLHQHRIEKLVILDEQGRCTGLVTVKDIEKLSRFPDAARDAQGRLRVGAAVSIGKDAFDRAAAMADAGLDAVFVDVAHAHNRDAIGTVSRIRQQRSSDVQVVAGNVATADAARSLIDAGADAIKVGLGVTETSASRRKMGIGMPQFTAVLNVVEQCGMQGIPVIVDGGIFGSAALVKAIAVGAGAVVIGQPFAGTDEAPGEIFHQDMRAYKIVNPAAKPQHRPLSTTLEHDVYHLDEDTPDMSVPYRGPVANVVKHFVDGLKGAMAYTGCKDIVDLHENAEFVRVR